MASGLFRLGEANGVCVFSNCGRGFPGIGRSDCDLADKKRAAFYGAYLSFLRTRRYGYRHGRVVNAAKGFGFIQADNGGKDVFVISPLSNESA